MRRVISSPEIERFGNEWIQRANTPLIGIKQFRYTPIEIVLLHEGSQQKLEEDKSNLIYKIENSVLEFSDLTFKFNVLYENSSVEKFTNDYYKELTVRVKAYSKFKSGKTVNFQNSIGINLEGNEEVQARVEITPTVSMIDVVLKGFVDDITLRNLTANKTIVIADGLVMEDGANKYKDYDSWGFPTLRPGINNLSVNRSNLNIVVKYKPRWI